MPYYNSVNRTTPPVTQKGSSGITPNNTSKCIGCNAGSSNTKNPSLSHNLDYQMIPKSSLPPCIVNRGCIEGNQFTTKHNFTSTGYYQKQGCAEQAYQPVPGQGCATTGVPCVNQLLGKVIIDPDRDGTISWSSITTTALAGTPAANPYVLIRHSDGCGIPQCGSENGDNDNDLRIFDAVSATWVNYTPVFDSEIESQSISGSGLEDDPYVLDKEYIAANLLEVLGQDLLTQYGWQQV